MKKAAKKVLTKKEAQDYANKLMAEAKEQIGKTPLDALTFMCKIAPRSALHHIQGCIVEILEVEIPKEAQLRAGHFKNLDPTKQTIEAMFLKSMGALHEHGDLADTITRTVEDSAQDIAKAIDKGVKRMMLGEKIKNVGAYLDMCSQHAKLTAALGRLMVKPILPDELPPLEKKSGDSD